MHERRTSRVDNESRARDVRAHEGARAWDLLRSSATRGTRGGHRLASASGEGRGRTSWKTRDPRVQSVPRVTAAAPMVGVRGKGVGRKGQLHSYGQRALDGGAREAAARRGEAPSYKDSRIQLFTIILSPSLPHKHAFP